MFDIDQNIVESAQAGSDVALEELYVSLHALCAYVGFRMLHLSETALEEFVHDAASHILTHIGQFNNGSKFSTWAVSVARNYALGILRARHSYDLVYLDAPTTDGHSPVQLMSSERLEETSIARIDAAHLLDMLSPDDRFIIENFYIQQRSRAEIAASCGLTVKALASRLHRIIYALKTDSYTGLGRWRKPLEHAPVPSSEQVDEVLRSICDQMKSEEK